MSDLDITEPIKKPTDWVNGLVIVKKCEHLHLPTAEEIFSQITGACFFSKLDASLGCWQIKVDEESSHLLALGTPLGRFCFKRLS